jgi:hypothetical protein
LRRIVQQRGETRARQQLLRVRWYGARGEHRQIEEVRHLCNALRPGAAEQDVAQTHVPVHVEEHMLTGTTQVSIDQQRALAHLRECDCQIGGHEAAPLARDSAQDRDGRRQGRASGLLHAEAGSQRTHLLGKRPERAKGRDDARRHRSIGGVEVRILELAREGELDVGQRQELQLDGRVAKPQPVLTLRLGDAACRFGVEEAGRDEDLADRTRRLLLHLRLAELRQRRIVKLHVHRLCLRWPLMPQRCGLAAVWRSISRPVAQRAAVSPAPAARRRRTDRQRCE